MNRKLTERRLWLAVTLRNKTEIEKIYQEVDDEYFKRIRVVDETGYEPKGFSAFEAFHGLVCSAVLDARSERFENGK